MRRALKILGWIAAVILLLVAIAGAALFFGGGRAVAWALEHPVSTMVGRQIHVGGRLAIRWGDPSRIVAEDVHIANAPWGSEPDMFSARRLEIELYARTLLHGPTRIPLISLDGAKLLLETSKKGAHNWDFGGAKSTTPKKRSQFPDLRHFAVSDSRLVFHNGETEARSELGIAKLDLQQHDPTSPVIIAVDGRFQKAPLRLAGQVGPIAQLRDPQQPYPIKFNGRLDGIDLATDGAIDRPLDFAGINLRLSLSGTKLHELADILGVPLPELPDFRSTAMLTGGNGKYALKALSMKTGQSDLEGGIAVDTNPKVPQIEANLTSKLIDLADFKGLYGGKPPDSSAPAKPPDPGGRVIPNTPISVQKLPGVNAELNFDGTNIKSAGGLPLERVSMGVTVKDGALELRRLRFHAAQGNVDVSFHFTPFTKSGPPHLIANVDIRHVDLHQLLGGPSMPDIVKETAGIVGGFVKIDTSGVSMREFLERMNGDAGIFMENGKLSALLEQLAPINVLGALGVYVRGDKPVQIDCFVSRFGIKQGTATATTLLFDTHDDTVVGEGNINFADETLYLRLAPYNKSFTTMTLRTPVDVRGTFNKPDYHLEVGGLAARLGAAVGLGVL
ncbi:MAG TPA: AsmA family protein, partial [Stellaceae bacterium]|nr:AsmA family protein [Stellaceae bacterium]